MVRPSSARPIRAPPEKSSSDGAALRGPGLEDPGAVDDQHPVRPRLRAQLVGLVEQVGAIVGAERLADAGHVGGHLDQRRGELAKAPAPARERVADGGAGGAKGASGGGLRGGVGAGPRDQQRRAQRRHYHERGAERRSWCRGASSVSPPLLRIRLTVLVEVWLEAVPSCVELERDVGQARRPGHPAAGSARPRARARRGGCSWPGGTAGRRNEPSPEGCAK